MRRLGALGAGAFLLFFTPGVAAAPIGWVDPFAGRWRAGAEVGFTLDRDLEAAGRPSARFEVDRRFAYLGRLSYSLTDSWEVYGRVGVASLRLRDSSPGDSTTTAGNLYDLGEEFAWGPGLRGLVRRDLVPGWDVAVDAQYFEHTGDAGRITEGPGAGSVVSGLDYREWSVAVLFQGEYGWMRPYVGPVFGDVSIGGGGLDLEASDRVGVVAGAGWEREGWHGYVEGRFVDETAVDLGVVWTF